MATKTVVVAGASGVLGLLICKHLLNKGGAGLRVLALIRKSSKPVSADLQALVTSSNGRLKVVQVNYTSASDIDGVFAGANVFSVVSAVQGLADVVLDVQLALLDAAIKHKVKRFIPSDYSVDFNLLPVGSNRNLDLRRDFNTKADAKVAETGSSIQLVSVLQGCFTEILLEGLNLVNFKTGGVEYLGDPDLPWEFTTWDNTGEFTACVALDDRTDLPRAALIAGDAVSPRQAAEIASKISGKPASMSQQASVWFLSYVLIPAAKWLAPGGKDELMPLWQKMQYGYAMSSGYVRHEPSVYLNARYPEIKWVKLEAIIRQGFEKAAKEAK
ncbi:hypothetical protein HDU96_006534 [Phlyctochytrium bullatum]|nr:hypothetical protein HDU96_006534 [Phlyctochytrium bullatum]